MVLLASTGPAWGLTLAQAAENVRDGDSIRSRVPTGGREKFGAERLHPIVTNLRFRPISDIRRTRLLASKQTFGLPAKEGGQRSACQRLPKRSEYPGTSGRPGNCSTALTDRSDRSEWHLNCYRTFRYDHRGC